MSGKQSTQVSDLRGNHETPCVEAQKSRSFANGNLVFDRWCIVHHHWLNDEPPAKSVIAAEIERLSQQNTGANP